MYNALTKAIQNNTQLCQDLWVKLCKIETPSSNKEQLDKLIDVLEQFSKDRGYPCTRTPFPKAGDCLRIEVPGDNRPPILLMAHMDTVHAMGAFGSDPVRIEGETIYGPGTVDCKGGAAVAFLTAMALEEAKIPHPPIRMNFTTDEEVSAMYSGDAGKQYITEAAKGVQAVFNCETTRPNRVVTGRKGITKVEIQITGKAAHAGNAYFSGVSAIREAAHKILALETLSEEGGCTFNCGVISGGTVANAVPEHCTIAVDIRALTPETMEKAVAQARDIAETAFVPGTHSQFHISSCRPPMPYTEGNKKLFQYYDKIAQECGFGAMEAAVTGGGSDAAYTTIAGVPTICSCGIEGIGEHTLNEQASLSSLPKRSLILALAIAKI